jgi:hypothetical protein
MSTPRSTFGTVRALLRSTVATVVITVVAVFTTVAGIAVSAGSAASASAAPAASATLAANGSAQFFAGYILTPTHGVASVSTTFTVPTITCAAGSGPGQSFGVWGFDTQTAYVAESAVQTFCSGTTPVYNFFILANSVHFTEPGVGPGNKIVASYYETPGWTQATVHDLTSGVTWIANFATSFLPASQIDIGAMSIPGNGRVAPFGTAHFTKTQVNGDSLGFQSPAGFNWVGEHSHLLVSTTAITGTDSFNLIFHRSS